MTSDTLQDIYSLKELDSQGIECDDFYGKLTEKDVFIAGKLILLGLAILYIVTLVGSFYTKENATILLDICKTVFPPLATLIIAFYFRDKVN